MIVSVARASEKGILAYETQQDQIRRHLFTIAEMVDWLDRFGKATPGELKNIESTDNLVGLTIIDTDNRLVYSQGQDSGDGFDVKTERIKSLRQGESNRLPLNFIDLTSGKRAFAVAIKRSRGGAIILGLDAAELLKIRQTLGAGSVIEDIGNSPGVEYAGIVKDGFILAASEKFAGESLDEWSNLNDTQTNGIKTRIRRPYSEDNREVFEAMGPFTIGGQLYGDILIGLNTEYLSLLTNKIRRDIFWRSLLLLIVAVTAIGGFWLRQNYRIISKQYNEILHEVQTLEQDKAISSRLVAMGELASGVAHEIRNPLNAIRVIIQRLQREFVPQDDKVEYKELTDIIRKETDRINNTIEQFLNFARPPVLHKSLSNINDCLKEIVALFEPRAKTKQCLVKVEYGALPQINFDHELCRQAFLNLLDNALAAVGIEPVIEVRTYKRGEMCIIEISDNGAGIPDNAKQRVFDLYFTTKPGGTGLGLPTVLRIVKEHGGRIDLLDAPSGGALFRLELPLES